MVFQISEHPELDNVWIAFNLAGGNIGIPLLLITLYFSDLRRSKTLYNLLLTFVAESIAALLLFYAGRERSTDPQPEYTLCVAQGALMLALEFGCACSAFALQCETWLVISNRLSGKSDVNRNVRDILLVAFPWVAIVVMGVVAFAIGATSATDLGRTRHYFYCTFHSRPLDVVIGVLTIILLFGSAYFTIRTATTLYHCWGTPLTEFKCPLPIPRSLRPKRKSSSSTDESDYDVESTTDAGSSNSNSNLKSSSKACPKDEGSLNPWILIRILCFEVWVLIAIGLTVWGTSGAPNEPLPYLIWAAIPLVVFLIFATQEDILNVWIRWTSRAFSFVTRRRST